MIKTKASQIKELKAKENFKAVKFEKLKRLPKTAPPQSYKNAKDSDDEFNEVFGDGAGRSKKSTRNKEVTFDSARREILNFGISGKNADVKSNQTEQLLIKLGAKPTKQKGKNYKLLLDEKRKLKADSANINTRSLFGTSATLQYRSQKQPSTSHKNKTIKKNDELLKQYGKLSKADRKNIKIHSRK